MSDSPLQQTLGARQRAFLSSAADFHKLRTRVTRRVHLQRRYLAIQQKGAKFVLSPLTKEEYAQQRYYLMWLMLVEKDVLYALELRSLNDVKRSKLIVTRLKRALERATVLCKAGADEQDQWKRLELLVYTELIRAECAIAQKKWDAANQSFALVRCALQFLENEGSAENKVLYKDIIEENVDESFKLAIYREHKINSADLGEFSKKLVDKDHEIYQLISSMPEGPQYLVSTDDSELIKEVQWRDYTARVKDETTSRLLTRVSTLTTTTINEYDTKLQLLQDALDTHQSYISRATEDEEEQDDQILLAYIQYTILLTRAQRDNTLLANANKKESLRILDTIITTIKEMQDLPGVYSDDELYSNLTHLVEYFTALKLEILTAVYTQSREYTKSLTLITESLRLLSTPLTLSFPGLAEPQDHTQLKEKLVQRQAHLTALTSLKTSTVADDVSKFSTGKIVEFAVQQCPPKPVLFDVAWNYLTQPAGVPQSAKAEVTVVEEKKEKKGLFGFFR